MADFAADDSVDGTDALTDINEKDKDFILRSYQIELLEICKSTNSIVFLPTGSGKTLIAIFVLKSYGYTLEGSLADGGKRCLFLAPTKALVYQHADLLRRQTAFRVGSFTSENGVDYWTESRWFKEFDQYQVLIMTPAIVQLVLSHSQIRLDKFSLLIIDECHNGVGEQPFRAVMRELKDIPQESQPRIIGLTATLLNRSIKLHKIKDELESLERTYHGKIATSEMMAEVLRFSADPSLKIVQYTQSAKFELFEKIQENCLIAAEKCTKIFEEVEHPKTPIGYTFFAKDSILKVVRRALEDINVNMNMYGIYAGSIVILYYIFDFEVKRMMNKTEVCQLIYSEVSTFLHLMRAKLMAIMEDNDDAHNILRFGSPKLLKLLELLKEHDADTKSIIFVQRRTTAVMLSFILRKLSSGIPDYKAINCSFLMGGRGNPLTMQRLNLLDLRRMQRSLKEFAVGNINTMVATSVMEEGVDIPTCNRVYHMDSELLHYRCFVQCKGRARDKTGQFIMFTATENFAKVTKIVNTCIETEQTLYKLLVGKYAEREAPTNTSIKDELYTEEIEPYYVDGPNSAHVNGVTAIACVSRYCASLPQDAFSHLKPLIFFQNVDNGIRFAFRFPINSPIHDLILGEVKADKKLAKRSAFVEAVRTLHEAKELGDNLLPKQLAEENYDYIFPNFKIEETTKETNYPGSKRRHQIYDLKHPLALCGCLPMPNVECYLHVLVFQPTYNEPSSNSEKVFYEMLKNPRTFAMLSTKPVPNICDFSIYLTADEVRCVIRTSPKKFKFSEADLNNIANFHLEIFSRVGSISNCLILNKSSEENSFYVVPVLLSNDNCFDIDWDTILNVGKAFNKIKDGDYSSVEETHELSVISTDYRENSELYIVTKVLKDTTPMTEFPDLEKSKTYFSYYLTNYSAKIENLNQCLVEVKRMPHNKSFLVPSKRLATGIRGQRKNFLREVLVPELCSRYSFPSILWLKLTFLPTALYRINQLLIIREFHERVVQEAKVGNVPDRWAPLVPDIDPVQLNSPAKIKKMPPISDSIVASLSPVAGEPMDIYQNMDKVADCDLKYLVEYIKPSKVPENADTVLNKVNFKTPPVTKGLKLNILESNNMNGPELGSLLAAVTSKSAHDIFNLERMETLGDSFLKFAASFFLFMECPKLNEGAITSLKGKLVSNRNLLYCGQAKDIPALFQSQVFHPTEEWLPPLAEIPEVIRTRLEVEKLNPGILYRMTVDRDEKFNLKPQTLMKMHRLLDEADEVTEERLLSCSMVLLKKKILSDKGIADSIEAIIGAYLLSFGIDGALKILKWLKILPAFGLNTNLDYLFKTPAPSPKFPSSSMADVVRHLQQNQAHELEKMLNYEFRDKSFLLQALTHPTYALHNATDCYQRLEFLGDAVIDFLVTCFIYQELPDLGPGDITMLRSALVNNTTFACQIVRYGIYRYMFYISKDLADAITSFVSEQENRDHVVDSTVVVLLEEKDCNIAETVDVPKALGDLMESLAGAIFLDSGNSLQTVWRVLYPFFKSELDAFSQNIPKNAVSLLHELNNARFKCITEVKPGVSKAVVEVTMPHGDIETFNGFGTCKFNAKISAAKLALRHYQMAKEPRR